MLFVALVVCAKLDLLQEEEENLCPCTVGFSPMTLLGLEPKWLEPKWLRTQKPD